MNTSPIAANSLSQRLLPLCSMKLQEAIVKKDAKQIGKLVYAHQDHLLVVPLPNGTLPLHFALRVAPLEVVSTFFQTGRHLKAVLMKDRDDMTAIDHAIISRSADKVKLIFSTIFYNHAEKWNGNVAQAVWNANIQALNSNYVDNATYTQYIQQACQPEDACHLSEIHLAALNGNPDALELSLLAKTNINSQTRNGWTPLHFAVAGGHYFLVTELLKHGAQTNLRTNHGLTALHLAANGNNKGILEILVKHGMDLKATDKHGFLPAHYAAANENILNIQYLFNTNPETLLINNRYGRTALGQLLSISIQRAFERNPLGIDTVSAKHSLSFPEMNLLFLGTAFSFVSQMDPDTEVSSFFNVIGQTINTGVPLYLLLSSSKKPPLKKITAFVILHYFRNIPGFNVALEAWKTWMVGSAAFRGIRRCWRQRVYGFTWPFLISLQYSACAALWAAHSVYNISQSVQSIYQNKMDKGSYWNEFVQRGKQLLNIETTSQNLLTSNSQAPAVKANPCAGLSVPDCVKVDQLNPSDRNHAKILLQLRDSFTEQGCKDSYQQLYVKYHPDNQHNTLPLEQSKLIINRLTQSRNTLCPAKT